MFNAEKKKYRLVTKSDLDGFVCAVLLKHLGMIGSIKFAHPRDVENGNVQITDNDILAGLPYKEGAHMVFDNYPGTEKKVRKKKTNLVCDSSALSNARVIYKHFGGGKKFPQIPEEMMETVDKGYSAKFTKDEILYPSSWELLNYLMDQRTGLERFKKFKISHYELIQKLINYKYHSILEILSLPDVEERVDSYFSCMDKAKTQILRNATVYYNLVVIDMRKEKIIYPGNRFIIYALFPECNVSLQVTEDSNNNTVFSAGKSIIDRSYRANIGKMLSKYSGGGHANAGTCQVSNGRANEVLGELINKLKYGLLKNLFLGYFD